MNPLEGQTLQIWSQIELKTDTSTSFHVFHLSTQFYHHPCSDDDSRVVLETIPGVEGSDYINASFIDVSILK